MLGAARLPFFEEAFRGHATGLGKRVAGFCRTRATRLSTSARARDLTTRAREPRRAAFARHFPPVLLQSARKIPETAAMPVIAVHQVTSGTQDCARFRPGTAEPVRRLRSLAASIGADSSTARGKFAVGGMTAGMLLDALNPAFAAAHTGQAGRQPAQDRVGRVPLTRRHAPRRAATSSARPMPPQAAGHSRGPRESRAQSTHRGHRPPLRARKFPGVRARRASRRSAAIRVTRQGARGLHAARSGEDARRLRRRGRRCLKGRPECTGKIGAVGFCYGGGIVNMLATRTARPCRRCPVLRQPAVTRGRREDQNTAG